MTTTRRKPTIRDAIKDAYERPEYDVPWCLLEGVALNTTRQALLNDAPGLGFEVVHAGQIDHDEPRWRKRTPGADQTEYYSARRASFRVAGVRRKVDRGLVAFDVTWAGRNAPTCWIRFAGWDWRPSSVTELRAELDALSV